MDQSPVLPVHLRPLKNYAIVRQDPEKDRLPSGLFLPDDVSQRFENFATVVAIGPDVDDVKPGDRVVFERTANSAIYPDTREVVPDEFKDLLRLKTGPKGAILAVIEEE